MSVGARTVVLRTALLALAMSGTGCAYLSTYTRKVDLEQNSYALDIKQRVVFSKKSIFGRRIICAEPSPDALAVIGASFGASAANVIAQDSRKAAEARDVSESQAQDASSSRTANQALNVTSALAEQGAFVGLRTQSIQLLRDAMYRLCEGYAADAIHPEEFTAMQRRYQSTMMGLLAIEQLTRPVVAQQIVLATTSGGQAGLSPGDEAYKKAQERYELKLAAEAQASAALEEATGSEAAARKQLQENRVKAAAARDKAKKETDGDAAAKEAAANAAAKTLDEALPALETLLEDAQRSVRNARRDAEIATKLRRDAEADLSQAKSRSSTYASGSSKIGEPQDASALITAELTKGVVKIVKEINKSYLRDGCFALLAELANPERQKILEILEADDANTKKAKIAAQELRKQVLSSCATYLELEESEKMKDLKKQNERQENKSSQTPPKAQTIQPSPG